jgi:catechol 2,3-dioxygenase-like lactoylglutathione lyase family enzyme
MPDSAQVTRITTIELPVADLDRAVAWYGRHLALTTTWRGEHEAGMAIAAGDPVGLFLVQTAASERLTFHNSRHNHTQSIVDFFTPDLAGLHARLKREGVDVNDLSTGARGFGFRDADGNSLGAHCAADT